MPTHELLAPAGSLESFFAAMEAGADAVYCGLKEFSARAKAKNFTLAEIERLAAYAHHHDRRLYVTLNTLLKEAELPRMLEILADLASFSVDGIIIQDLGLWRLVRQHFPELPLHASTQMTIHNAAGVKRLEGMGFTRAVLARELSLEEITAIRQQTRIELEHFVHGALCYSLSGQCLFSSFLTGNSGNRGRCAQPCRRRYTERGKTGFYFSTSDLSTISLLPRLAGAGVFSFKIEGRMKNAEYVSAVVSAYRAVLEARPTDLQQTIKAAEESLAEAFGRSTTTGLMKGKAPAGIAVPSTKGAIGRLLGSVEKIQGSAVCLTTQAVVHVGDRLRIQPQSDLAGSAFTVQELFVGDQKLKRAEAKSVIRIGTPFRGIFHQGDQVYKVSTGKGFTLSEEACQRRLFSVDLPALPVQLTVSCLAANRLTLEAKAAGCRLKEEYEAEMLPAANSPLSRETLQPTFAKTGHVTFQLGSFTVGHLPPVVIKPSRLNEVRREFYATLSQQIVATIAERRVQRIEAVLATLLPVCPPSPNGSQGLERDFAATTEAAYFPEPVSDGRMPQMRERGLRAIASLCEQVSDKADAVSSHRLLTVVGRGFRDLAILQNQAFTSTVKRVLLSLSPDNVDAVSKGAGGLKTLPEQILWDIPALIFEGEWRAFQSVVKQLMRQGYSHFRLNNLSHFALFADQDRVRLMAGPWLYALNSQAALALAELGAQQFTLSLEDDQTNMAAILSRAVKASASVVVYSQIEVMTSRIPMRAMPQGSVLAADSGETLRLGFGTGLTVVRAGQEFSLSGRLHELRRMGCREFIVDLSAVGLESKRGKEVMAAVLADQELPGASLFNFERGLA